MGTYTVYRLKFKTQLHLGRATGAAQTGSLGLEKTETYIPADTLFSALCQTWATFYDTASLTDFLNQYTAENESLPFTLTSAFPFAHDIYFFPKPLIFKSTSKKSKRVQFVSRSLFENIITGNPPDFDEDNLMNSEKVWVNSEEKDQLKNVMDEKLSVWETTTRPRVSIDRQTEESSIWHVETVQFNKCCGLWFAVNYDSDETKQKIETILRVLGDNGIGGERNAGYGLFDFGEVALDIPTAEDSTQFVTLSPICPKSSEQLEHLLKGDIAYNLNPLTGWVGSHGTYKRRKQINMFAEGSVLNTCDEPVGRLVDLTPKGYPHPVYRYGYAWQVRLKR
jgi:CRISPR-associated protein Csm4